MLCEKSQSIFLCASFSVLLTCNNGRPNPQLLVDLVTMKMPFGKYKGTTLCDLPTYYLEWFAKEGFPDGKLGMLLSTIFEIKINGLEDLLKPLKNKRRF